MTKNLLSETNKTGLERGIAINPPFSVISQGIESVAIEAQRQRQQQEKTSELKGFDRLSDVSIEVKVKASRALQITVGNLEKTDYRIGLYDSKMKQITSLDISLSKSKLKDGERAAMTIDVSELKSPRFIVTFEKMSGEKWIKGSAAVVRCDGQARIILMEEWDTGEPERENKGRQIAKADVPGKRG
jgi:hypothetical protein